MKQYINEQNEFRKKSGYKGSGLVEFLLVFPVLMLIIFGSIELGVLFYNHAVIYHASKEGARYGVVIRNSSYATTTEISNYTRNFCTNHLFTFATTPATPTITITQSITPPKSGGLLTVKVSYLYTYLVLHKIAGITQQNTITATTVMTYE